MHPEPATVRVVLAEDGVLLREGLAGLLGRFGFQTVAVVGDAGRPEPGAGPRPRTVPVPLASSEPEHAPFTATSEVGAMGGSLAIPESGDLLERERELADLTTALKEVCSGTGRLLVLAGAAGVGKSRLLAAACGQARAADMTVLAARGLELERDFPFGLALRLLEPVLRAGALPGHPAQALADGLDHGYAMVHRLRELAVGLLAPRTGTQAPLLIAVDDAEWADGPSLRFLLRLTADLDTLPLAMIVAVREGEPGARTAFLDRLAAQATVLRPGALSAGAAAVVVRGTYPHPAPEFCAACAQASGGNPFFLHELLAAARADGIPATAEGAARVGRLLPESVLRSVLLRVARVPAGSPLASAVAVLGDGAAVHHAASLAGLDEQAAERAADDLARAGILRPGMALGFSHPLIAAAVRDDMPAMARSRAHRRAADLLMADGAPAEEVAGHLAACRPGADEAAAAVLGRAAEQVAGRGDYDCARRFLERALAERLAPEPRGQLRLQLAVVQAATGTPDAIAQLTQALDALRDPRERARALRALAQLLFARSDSAGAVHAVSSALAQLPGDDPLRRELISDQLVLAGIRPDLCAGPAGEMRDIVLAAQAGALPADPAVAAQAAGWLADAGQPAALVRDVASRALPIAGRDDAFYGTATGFAVYALIEIDELDLAERAISAAAAHARRAGSLIRTGFTSHWRAMLCYCRGELAEAVTAAGDTLEACRSGWDVCRPWAAPLLAKAQTARGDLAAADAALRLCPDTAQADPVRALAFEARGELALARGDAAGALADFEAAGEIAAAVRGPSLLGLLPWRPAAVPAAIAAGRREYAADLARTGLDSARRTGARRALGVALRAAGMAAGGERGLGLLAESAAVLEDSPAQLERAATLAELGAARRRAGQRREAREPLRRAAGLAQRLGAAPLAARAAQELALAGGRRRAAREVTGVAALTPAELRVARLAAGGRSTAEIAQALVLSRKTVEWHLGHVYRKLGIGTRRELRGALGPQPPAGPQPRGGGR